MFLLVVVDEPDDAHPAQAASGRHPRDDRARVTGPVDQRRRRAPGGHDPAPSLERRPHEDPRTRREGEEHEGLQQEERTRERARARRIQAVEDEERHDHDHGTDHHGPDEIDQVADRGVAPLAPMQPEGDVDERPDRERQQGGGKVRQDRDREVGRVEADAEHDDGLQRTRRRCRARTAASPSGGAPGPSRRWTNRSIRSSATPSNLPPSVFGRSRWAWYFATVQNDEIAGPRWPGRRGAGSTSVLPRKYRWSGGTRGRGWDDAAAMSARQLPHDPSPEPGSDPGLAPTRPSLYRRLLGGSGAFGDALTADSSDSPETQLAERLDTILNIAERLAATHDRTELFRTIVDETLRALQVDHVTIRVVEDGGLVVAAWAGLSDEAARALPAFSVDEGWVGEVLRTGQVAAWSDAREDRPDGAERPEGIVEIAGDLIAPLIHHDRVIGALSAVTREPRDWTDGDIAFLTTLATHAGIALTNAELFEQTEARAAQLARAAGRVRAPEPRVVRGGGRAGRSSRRPARSSTTTTPACTSWSCPTRWCRSPSRAGWAPTSMSTWTCCAAPSAKGSPAGSPSTASHC